MIEDFKIFVTSVDDIMVKSRGTLTDKDNLVVKVKKERLEWTIYLPTQKGRTELLNIIT